MRHTMISAAVLAMFSLSAHGADGLGEYSFDYDVTGDRSIRPVQVFDNGQSVYIQLSARAKTPPAVMEKVGEQVRPVTFRYEYPYLVVDNVRGEIVLALDGRSALVSKRSLGAVTGAATPILVGRAAAPVVGGAARPAYPAAAPVAPTAGQPDYAGEMVYRQMRGSSLAPAHRPVRVAEAPSAADVAPVPRAPVPVPAKRGAVSSRDPGAAAQHYAAAGRVEKAVIHRVGYGDTLARVAAQYGVPARRIATDNGITNPNLIRVGQALTINRPDRTIMASAAPVAVERAAPLVHVEVSPSNQVEKAVIHRVGYGDTLARVAAQYGVPARRIAADNGITNPNLIRVGQALTINRPDRTIMASAAPVAVERAAPPVHVAATPVAAPSFASNALSRGTISEVSPSGRIEILRVAGVSPTIDAKLLAAVRRAIAQQGEIMLRGHSSAMTASERSEIANASAEAVRDQLIKKGIPADRLTLVSNPGRVMSPSRVDVVLIGAKKHATV